MGGISADSNHTDHKQHYCQYELAAQTTGTNTPRKAGQEHDEQRYDAEHDIDDSIG
ncbi:hypothetical protein NXH56_02990 [Bifidobacterium thermophilum]|nr:hypothetical protein [Bifidobacterium thermophilum]